MFDMKPDAPDGIRSPHKWIDTNLPGVITNEHMPAVAKIMNKVTLVRSVHHTMKNHNSAGYYALSGSAPDFDDQRLRDTKEMYPAYGSVVDHLTRPRRHATFVAYPYIMRDGSAPRVNTPASSAKPTTRSCSRTIPTQRICPAGAEPAANIDPSD